MAGKRSTITQLLLIVANFTFGELIAQFYGQVNGNITLKPNAKDPPDEITWTHNRDIVLQYEPHEMTAYRQFKGRTILDKKTGDLTITHLTKGDSGQYKAELLKAGKLLYYDYRVEIIDALAKPAVTCQVNNDSTVTLLCAGDQSPLTQYSWEGPDTQDQPGYELQIGREESQSSDSVYTCVVKNPVSENREDFPVKSCFLAQDHSAIIGGVVGVLLFVLFIIVGVYFRCRNRNKRETTSQKEKDIEVLNHEEEQLILNDHHEESPKLNVQESGKCDEERFSPNKTCDDHQMKPVTEPHRTAESKVEISQEESQPESLSQGGPIDEREERSSVQISPKHEDEDPTPGPIQGFNTSTAGEEEKPVQGHGENVNTPPDKPPRSPLNLSAGKYLLQNAQDGEEQAPFATTSRDLPINKAPPIDAETPSDPVMSQNAQGIEQHEKTPATTSHDAPINKAPPNHEETPSDSVLSKSTQEIKKQTPTAPTSPDQDLHHQTAPPANQPSVDKNNKKHIKIDTSQNPAASRGPRPEVPKKPTNITLPNHHWKRSEPEKGSTDTETVSNPCAVRPSDNTGDQKITGPRERSEKAGDHLESSNWTMTSTIECEIQGDTTEKESETQGDTTEKESETQGDTTEKESETQGDTTEKESETQGYTTEDESETQGYTREEESETQGYTRENEFETQGSIIEKESEKQGDTTEKESETQGDTTEKESETQGDTTEKESETQGDTTEKESETQGYTTEDESETQGYTREEESETQGYTRENEFETQGSITEKESEKQGGTKKKESVRGPAVPPRPGRRRAT